MALSDFLRDIVKQVEKEARVKPMTIIEFAEAPSGLNYTLYPVQKFIFKVFYKIPLSSDINENRIIVKDQFNEKTLYEFDEVSFFKFLEREGRINLSFQDWEEMEDTIDEIIFVIGRRGSKTTMTSIISAYTVYLLLLMEDPHSYFGIVPNEPIGIALCSNSSEGAERQLRNLIQLINPSRFFQPYIYGTKGGKYWLRTVKFKEKEELGLTTSPGDILIEAYAASPSVRGASNIVVVMDEFGHFNDADVTNKKKPLDEKLYEALTPSVAGFTDDDGVAYGKSFIMSSPNGKKGALYKFYKNSFNDKTYLALNMPSNWVNYKISSKRLRNAYNKSELSFRQEYLGEFVDSAGGWISNKDKIKAMINMNMVNTLRNGVRGKKYFLGIDLAMSGDGFSLCVAHKEARRVNHKTEDEKLEILLNEKNIIVIDYIEYHLPEEGEVLDYEFIIQRIKNVYRYFNISRGYYDQWAGQVFTQLFAKHKVPRLEMIPSTQKLNSEVAKLFRQLIMEGRLMCPSDVDYFIDEISNLQETVSRNNYVKVEANSGEHDDVFDAVSRAVYMAYRLGEYEPYIPNSAKNNKVLEEKIKQQIKDNASKVKKNFGGMELPSSIKIKRKAPSYLINKRR